jgi:UDP-glucose 4-epimerase
VVTGGAGFIGSHLAEALLAMGIEVHVIDNLSSGDASRVPKQAVLHVEDIAGDACRDIIMRVKPDIVFHMAAQVDVNRSLQNPKQDADINIGGTVGMLVACRDAGVRKFVFSSTCAVYGDQQKERIAEETPPAPVSYYGLSKYSAEQYVRLFYQLYGLSYTILRYSNVFGPRQSAEGEGGVVSIFMDRMLSGRPLRVYGDGEQTRDFIFVEDVVRANLAAIHKGDQHTLNISTGLRTSINNLILMLQVINGSALDVAYLPPRDGDIRHSCLDPAQAGSVLGWKARENLFEGLLRTYHYHKFKA